MPNVIKGSHTSYPERFCKYIHRYCNQTRLEGYDYCIRHILEDRTAPFRQCMYVNPPNKKRCMNAAPKTEKNEKREHILCPFHAKRALIRTKANHQRKKIPLDGSSALIRYLEPHCSEPNHNPAYDRDTDIAEIYETTECTSGVPTSLNQNESSFADDEKSCLTNVDDDFYWVEKSGDYLEHAGVYTHKEVVTIAREKILRLQQLYCDELKVICNELKENRRKLLVEAANSMPSTSSEADAPTRPEVDLESLQSLMRYHRCSGTEKIIQHRTKRIGFRKLARKAVCTYERKGFKCTEHALVLTKFCVKHILSDPKQVMFKPCGRKHNCKKPVIPYEEKAACMQHVHWSWSKPISDEMPEPVPTNEPILEPEHFQSMDDIASLGLDAITPGSLFGLDQFGEPGESTDTVLSEDQTDLMQIQAITLNAQSDILSDSRKSESE